MIGVLIVAAQLATAWPWVGAANPPAHVLQPGKATVIAAQWRGKPVRLSISQTVVPNCHAAAWLHGAAPDRQDRCLRLGPLEITVAGQPMMVSSNGYADLGGVNDIVVRTTPTRMILFMRGPGGPEYYGATLEFDARDIVRRKLDLADGAAETTVYRAGPGVGL